MRASFKPLLGLMILLALAPACAGHSFRGFPDAFTWTFRGVAWLSPAPTWIGNATITLTSTPEGSMQVTTDAYAGPGPLWRPAGTYTDILLPGSSPGEKLVYTHHGKECRNYTTPRLQGEGPASVGEAFANSTYGGIDNKTAGCEPSKVSDGCEIWIVKGYSPTGAKSMLWRDGYPVWLNGFDVYTGDVQVSFYTLSYKAEAKPPIVPASWSCSSGCMAQINYDFTRCKAQWGMGQYCQNCDAIHREWRATADRKCTDPDFDFEIDIEDTEESYHCWCKEHKACVTEEGKGYKCVVCDQPTPWTKISNF